MSHHVGAEVEVSLARALDEAARDARASKSDLIRHALSEMLLDGAGEEYDFEIPSHLRKQIERERRKDENREMWHKIYFPQWVDEKFNELFKKGVLPNPIYPDAVDGVVDAYVEDARGIYDDPETQEAAVSFVKDYAEMVVEADDVSDFDALDPQKMFESYTGVQKGREMEEANNRLGELVEDAYDLITDSTGGTLIDSERVAPEEAVEILSSRTDVPDKLAEDAVDRALDRLDSGGNL